MICAERNGAPILYGFEKLDGGWYVVVMEHLDPRQYRPPTYADRSFMHSTAKEHITALHERGYVHGDIRTVNLFVGPEDRVMLLDFDWAGKIGEARYSENVNPSVDGFNTRPDGAEDGQLITVAHDLRMVDLLRSEHGLWFFSE